MTQGLPNFPTKRSIAAKVKKYSIAAHKRGEHKEPKATCPLCRPEPDKTG